MPALRMLRKWEPSSWADWLVPALACAAWWSVLAGAETVDDARSIVFVGGPLVLLSGLHARITGYLHARSRADLLPLPIPARSHWRLAQRRHRVGLWATVALGTAATWAAAQIGRADDPTSMAMSLCGDWLWLCAMALLTEPVIPALSSWLGRRFPTDSRWHALQAGASGGWTPSEAVIHLYAPALGVGLAALLALPGQLTWARVLSGAPVSGELRIVALAPLAVGVTLRAFAAWPYTRAIWEAVPWLREATTTLAGPALPERTPSWVARLGSPTRRLLVLQLLRTTPLPLLRLATFAGWTIILTARTTPPNAPQLGILVALLGLWLIPSATLHQDRGARARLFAGLPVPERDRRGGAAGVAPLVFAPPALLLAALLVRHGLLP